MEKLCLSLLLSLLLLIPGCQETLPEPKVVFTGIAMTMPYQVAIRKQLSEEEKQAIEEKIEAIFLETHRVFNKFNPDSELSVLNRWPANQPFHPSISLHALLQRTDAFVKLSKGLFDPSLKTGGWNTLRFAADAIIKTLPLTLDLGGIAKGTTIDTLLKAMNKLGHPSVLVEWGGDFAFSTKSKEEAPWRIALYGQDEILDVWEGGLATSGDYQQFWKEEEKTFFHLYNPLERRFLEQKSGHITSVSVLAPTAEEADAYATILLLVETEVAGKDLLPSTIKAWWTTRL